MQNTRIFIKTQLEKPIIQSLLLHLAVVLFIFIDIPFFSRDIDVSPPPLLAEVISEDIVKEENDGQKKKVPIPPPPPPAPPPKPAPQKPAPPAAENPTPKAVDDEAEAVPIKPKKAETKPPVKKQVQTVARKSPRLPAPPPKQPEPVKEKPKDEPKSNLSTILKSVEALKKEPTIKETEEKKTEDLAKKVLSALQKSDIVTPRAGDPLSNDDLAALRAQIADCWSITVGAEGAEDLAVELLIEVNPDRRVRNVEIVDKSRLSSDPFWRVAAENAVRALKHPKCEILDLPPEKYSYWQSMIFTFDPRHMFGTQ